jgi:hypothetical protein
VKKWGKASLTFPAPGRGEGKHIRIRKEIPSPLTGEGQGGGDLGNFFTPSGRARVGVIQGIISQLRGENGASGSMNFGSGFGTLYPPRLNGLDPEICGSAPNLPGNSSRGILA